jgi:predicted NACHT family NTPase
MSEPPKSESSHYDLRGAKFGGGFTGTDGNQVGGAFHDHSSNYNQEGTIWNLFFGQQATPVGNPARPENQRLLLADVKREVTIRLSSSLHNAVLINLAKELEPQQVKPPWGVEIKIGDKPSTPLPDTTSILGVFDANAIAGMLLILGAPGAGKTTTLLELAQALISRAEEQPDYPIPVLFNLSSWNNDRQPLSEWLVAELKSKYGVSKKLGQQWVKNRQLLPLLDGLDEVKPALHESCVRAINQLLRGEYRPQYLVVCSRLEEYGNSESRLQLNGAICLQPLTNAQVGRYLADVNHAGLWQVISDDIELLELVRTPLLLSITILVSEEISIEQWQQLTSTFDRIQYLLSAYVRQMLTREIDTKAYIKHEPPSSRQTRLWLVWLAQQLLNESKAEFLLEEMQPDWLRNKRHKWMYRQLVGLIGGLILGGGHGLIVGGGRGLIAGLIVGLYGYLIAARLPSKIATIETIKWSWKKFRNGLIYGLITGLIGGFILALFSLLFLVLLGLITGSQGLAWANLGLFGRLFLVLIGGPILGLINGLINGLIKGLSSSVIENKIIPNQGIWKTIAHTVTFGLIFGLIGGLIGKLVGGLIGGLMGGLLGGGLACTKHFILRLILYRNGYIPWNYARFLNYCTERLFLQRVGGRYRFIHKLVQDHFAQMEFERK